MFFQSQPTRRLRTPDAARHLGLSERTLEKHRVYGTGPTYQKLGGRVVYTIAALDKWAARGTRKSTSDTRRKAIVTTTRPSRPNTMWRQFATRLSQKIRGRHAYLSLAGVSMALISLAASAAIQPQKYVLWNASASVPIGLYWVNPDVQPRAGELAVADLRTDIKQLANDRRYLPRTVPLLKPVAAVAGQVVCRYGAQVTVDGHHLASAKPADRLGRALPVWSGCRTLSGSEVFLLNPKVADSFDGRYFGPTPGTLLHGRARPLILADRHRPN